MRLKRNASWLGAGLSALVAACSHTPPTITPVASVDLPRFMGDWYVIAHIPSRPEKNAFNAIESYRLDDKGKIRTSFRFREASFDAPVETMEPVGEVRPGTNNAVWGMQFIWPIKAEYVIVYVDADYTRTIIGRSDRDYAWIMARQPEMSPAEYQDALDTLKRLGYSLDGLRKVPQRWPEAPEPR